MYLQGGADYLYPGGYQNFDLSAPTNVAFNGGPNGEALPVNFSRRMPFELDSFDLAAAWRNELEVTVTGELCSPPASPQTCMVVHSTTLTVNQSGSTLETLNWDDVNKVVFQSVVGTGNPVFFEGYQFVLDNVTVSPGPKASADFAALRGIPEPSTWTLMLLGFAGFAAYTRSKRSVRFAGPLANVRSTWRQSPCRAR